jgi:hypothetical protein
VLGLASALGSTSFLVTVPGGSGAISWMVGTTHTNPQHDNGESPRSVISA